MSGKKKDREYDDMVEKEGNEIAAAEEATPEKVPEPGNEGQKTEEPLEEANERLLRENEELSNRILYLHAELDNFRKRSAKEKEQLIAFGNERLIRELLSVLDNLELGMIHGREDEGNSQLLSGVELTYNEFLKVLKKFGVEQLDAEDDRFDPSVHEAISSVAVPSMEPGTIYQVLRKGYMLNGRLIRPVQVVVVAEREKSDIDDPGSSDRTVN
ncbi:MAG: nucleotide exchange factor GrpE [Deltaproteobacteria bacterium]|nr:nucleotide exchange factor GrpE [Deltaproteobacteria bacterium]